MSEPISGVNPDILKWARKRAGFSVSGIAIAIKKDPNLIRAWESGDDYPSYVQLEALAYKYYKCSLAVFFFPEPPVEPNIRESFRTLPDREIEDLEPDTRLALREGKAKQLSLLELTDGLNPSDNPIFARVRVTSRSQIESLAMRVRKLLKVSIKTQSSWKNTNEAFKHWREILQDNGVFVFKRSMKQSEFSGFCLWDRVFPIIYINNSTSDSRQIFTLFHELAHIFLKTSGVTKTTDSYIDSLEKESRDIEVLCNKFAAEFLVPSSVLFDRPIPTLFDDAYFRRVSGEFNVSSEVILRKLLDHGHVTNSEYRAFVKRWHKEYIEKKKRKSGGGNYYATQATYLGEKYLSLVLSKYHAGKCTIEQVSEFLNIKAQNVANLEDFAVRIWAKK